MVAWLWFCGHCAAPSPGGAPPPPNERVCNSCGLGLLLEAREDAVPTDRDAFLVVDSSLLVQAMSRQAEAFLGVTEEDAIDRPVAELLVPADAEAQGRTSFAAAIVEAAERRRSRNVTSLRPSVEHVRCSHAGADRDLRAAAGGAGRAREQRPAAPARRRLLASAATRDAARAGARARRTSPAPPAARPSRPPAARSRAAR